MPEPVADRIVWIDCEMTGLDYRNDLLVEIACVVTDGDLNEIGEGFEAVIAAPAERLSAMDPFVINMHTESGLLPLIPDGMSVEAAQAGLLAYIQTLVPDAGKAPLAGSSVHVDRVFIERDMPNLAKMLHYRTIDVSSIKELARRWYPKVYFKSPTKTGNHRALGDIQDSIAELAHYRANLFAITPEN